MPTMLRKLTESDVTFDVLCEPEFEDIRGNCMASGDDDFDESVAQEIEADLDSGNPWAWCSIRVAAHWEGLEGVDYLGCCSYKSEEDFRAPGGYFDDMKAQALADLQAKLDRIQAKLA